MNENKWWVDMAYFLVQSTCKNFNNYGQVKTCGRCTKFIPIDEWNGKCIETGKILNITNMCEIYEK